MKYWKLPFLFFILSIYSSYAQNPARTGTDYAVLFYISDFEKGWETLPDSEDEIDGIAQALREDYGFQVDIVRNPDKVTIKKKISEVNSRQYGADDQVLFFFSSHGHFDKAADRGYLIPADGQLPQNDPYGDTWISYDDLGSRITRNRSEHTLLLLDACYSGAFGDRWMGGPSELPWESEADCREQAKSVLNYDSRIYFTSGSRERRTPARSLFVSRFLRFLRSGKDKKILRTRDLRYEFSTIEDPKPEGGTFTDRHEEYGDFVFVHKNACGSDAQMESDQEHWLSIQDDFSKENLELHMVLFPECEHQAVLNSLGIGFLEISGGESGDVDTTAGSKGTTPADLPGFVFVQGGIFQMGSNDSNASINEMPVHSVTVSDFYIHKNELTNEEFVRFLNSVKPSVSREDVKLNGNLIYDLVCTGCDDWEDRISYSSGRFSVNSDYSSHPVVMVSWYGAAEYCNWRSREDSLQKVYNISGSTVTASWNANGYRLPTEAEWEFAARSRGKNEKWAGTSMESSLVSYSNYSENGEIDGYKTTAPVGSFRANALDLYDMSGNVSEWCWDWFSGDYYGKSPSLNPRGPNSGTYRVRRGGNWYFLPRALRCSDRDKRNPDGRFSVMGFRLARSAR